MKKNIFASVKKTIKELPKSKQEMANDLLQKAIFMAEECEKLQLKLQEEGWTEVYQNGANQFGTKKASEADVYMSLTKNYVSTIKLLVDILPEGAQKDDELMEFLKK